MKSAIIVIITIYTSQWSVLSYRWIYRWFGPDKSEINGSCTVNPAAFSHGFARSGIRSTYHPMMLLVSRPNDRADRRSSSCSIAFLRNPPDSTNAASRQFHAEKCPNGFGIAESESDKVQFTVRRDDLSQRRKNSSLLPVENWQLRDPPGSFSARSPRRAWKPSRRQSAAALKGTATDRPGGSDDFKCGLKDIFREALYIYTRVYASMRTRECRAIYASATVSAFQTFFVARPAADVRTLPHAALWNSAYGMRAPATRRAASSSTADWQRSRIYVAPKLRRPPWISGATDRDVTREACRLSELSRFFGIRDIRAERILRELCRRESHSSFPRCEFSSRTISESKKRNGTNARVINIFTWSVLALR